MISDRERAFAALFQSFGTDGPVTDGLLDDMTALVVDVRRETWLAAASLVKEYYVEPAAHGVAYYANRPESLDYLSGLDTMAENIWHRLRAQAGQVTPSPKVSTRTGIAAICPTSSNMADSQAPAAVVSFIALKRLAPLMRCGTADSSTTPHTSRHTTGLG